MLIHERTLPHVIRAARKLSSYVRARTNCGRESSLLALLSNTQYRLISYYTY